MAEHGLSVFFPYSRRNGIVDRHEIWTAFRPVDGLFKLLADKMLDDVVYGPLVR